MSSSENRRYLRMNTVFPVELTIQVELGGSRLLQAFTRDVGAGGLCLELKSFGASTEKFLTLEAPLEMVINAAFSPRPIKAKGRIAWLKKEEQPYPPRYLIGVSYTEIEPQSNRRLLRFARNLIWLPRLAAVTGLLLLVALAVLFVKERQLIGENRKLVTQLVRTAEKQSDVASGLSQLQKKKVGLEEELNAAGLKIASLESNIASLTAENVSQKTAYENELQTAVERRQSLSAELRDVERGEQKLKTSYRRLDRFKAGSAAQVLQQMAAWLKTHQHLATGLVASFEGDASLQDWAFTYDQSLVCQVFLLTGNAPGAEAILRFYQERAAQSNGAFYNAYHTVDGQSIESNVHVGPNVWLGIAALQYGRLQGDARFLPLARQIGDWLAAAQDSEGGLKGGPGLPWYSTEHNLDAYAFFGMLFVETRDEKFRAAQGRTLEWMRKHAYSLKEKRMHRGKGDATISTDTFSWAIAAIGPATLEQIQFDPEAILQFAEKNCEVSVKYERPDGQAATARGFDFAKAEHVGRGGVLSTEWTAQMIVAYQVMADHYARSGAPEKAALYEDKADLYLNELQKLIITSPSRTGQGRGCLPYASADNADTGHGWRTPKGKRTGSVAGTAYGIFAWLRYNPFHLSDKENDAGF